MFESLGEVVEAVSSLTWNLTFTGDFLQSRTSWPGFSSTAGVTALLPSWSAWLLGDVGNYMHSLVQYFVQLGYIRGDTIRW